MRIKQLFVIPLALFALVGCSTVTEYEARTDAGPAKPADYPIYIYPQTVEVPRPFEVIGTMRVNDTPLTVTGGKLEDVLNKLRQSARAKGADALQLKAIKEPGFLSGNYGAEAHFLRFTAPWESFPVTTESLSQHFKTNAPALDPIEGIWRGNDPMQSRIAVLRNQQKPGRDFVAVLLNTRNVSWQKGDKKLDLVRGERPGVYRGTIYLEDYQPRRVAFALRGVPANRFSLQISEEAAPLIFTREN